MALEVYILSLIHIFRVDGKGEIEDRRALGQLDQLAGRREDVELILIAVSYTHLSSLIRWVII